MIPSPFVLIFPTMESFATATAEHILSSIRIRIETAGVCSLALAGGSTPRMVYREIVRLSMDTPPDWTRVHIFSGDERWVPPRHPMSNYAMAKQVLLDHTPIPPSNIHRFEAERTPEHAAQKMCDDIRAILGDEPVLDIVLLGLGEDGHTASLFPSSFSTDSRAVAVPAYVQRLRSWRLTLSLDMINRAREVFFLVSGSAKAPIVATMFGMKEPDPQFPASMIQPANGKLLWMLDGSAGTAVSERR